MGKEVGKGGKGKNIEEIPGRKVRNFASDWTQHSCGKKQLL